MRTQHLRLRAALALVFLLTAALLPAACAANPTPSVSKQAAEATPKVMSVDGGKYYDVSAAILSEMLKQKDFPLINVHIPYEGEIAGTDLFIPYNEIEANLGKLPQDKAAKLFLYCRSGAMSAIAARTLVRLGHTNVWDLEGGMIAWKEAGHKLN